jgi:RNA polymerase sigma-70 factor (ECF subfamily)
LVLFVTPPIKPRAGSDPPAALAPASEARKVSAARAGDTDAFADLVAPHLDAAFRSAFLITGSAADAQDAAQEALVKAWLALDRFRTGAPFRPWFVRIVINEAHNRRRATGRQAGLALRLADTHGHAILGSEGADRGEATVPGAEAVALAAERRARLLAAVSSLREDDQLVIAARYFVGLSEAETATALSLRAGTVKSRLSRALARLREVLGDTT